MEQGSLAPARGGNVRWRIWALLPLLLLVGVLAATAAGGHSLIGLVGHKPPPPLDQIDIPRVEFKPGAIRIHVTNPQHADITIAAVSIDNAIVAYRVDGSTQLGRLASRTIVVPFDWNDGEPISVGVTSSSGIQTTKDIPAAVATPDPSSRGFLGYALIGFLVGVLPVALGLGWLPSLRRADPRWVAAFMALTAGLLTFLAFEALSDALKLQAALPDAINGVGLVVLGVASSYLALTWIASRFSAKGGRDRNAALDGTRLAMLVAIGIGLHNLSEGLAIGSSLALGELALGTFLIIGFMAHNITEGLGIAAPLAQSGRVSIARLTTLALVGGAPAILGAWIGGFLTNNILGVLFFAIAVGAAAQVVVEVARYVSRRAPGGLASSHAIGGFITGIAIMYTTSLLAG